MNKARLFTLSRLRDKSGISGTGVVAEGVLFHNGKVALVWFSQIQTVEVADTYNDFLNAHVYNHNNSSLVTWSDGKEESFE